VFGQYAGSSLILVGKNKEKGKVLESRATSDALNEILKKEREIKIHVS